MRSVPRFRSSFRSPAVGVPLSVWLFAGALSALATPGRAQEFAPSLYIRTDTDNTTVVSPRLRGRAEVADATNLDLVYAVDIWTSASVDVVASASEPVTEQRDEIDVGIDHTFPDLVLSAGYRYSHEPDYISHGGHIGASLDMADKSTTLALGLAFSADKVGRAGYPDFSHPAQTAGVQTSLTQVIDRDTLIQALYDLGQVSGYQVSPYRRVALGGDGNCAGDAPWCFPEHSPDVRWRHAWAVRARRALGDRTSAGAGYRFYLDSWGMTSHTFSVSASWIPTQQTTLSVQYRGYVQSAVDYYQKHYDLSALGSFMTSTGAMLSSSLRVPSLSVQVNRP